MIWRRLAFALIILAMPLPAWAHPHAWIDLRSQVLLDDQGRVAGLRLEWMFDDYYTVAIADEVDVSQANDERWTEIAGRNLDNLASYDYFTAIKVDGEAVPLGEVRTYEGGLRDGRMWMRFEVPLRQPVDPSAHEVAFGVFDPTYYIEIVHLEDDIVTFEGAGAERCLAEIVQPQPTFEQVSLASALDKDETAGDGLGELFAETVILHC